MFIEWEELGSDALCFEAPPPVAELEELWAVEDEVPPPPLPPWALLDREEDEGPA